MRFFSKLVVICNMCFLIAVLLRVIENLRKKNILFTGRVILNPVESTFVILGYGAIIVNIIFNCILLILFISKRKPNIPSWIVVFNFLLLLVQLFYFLVKV
ncbi:MAG TPA: hypothetical protein VK559_04505 [Ferruginibacter sp.]|nr:hypothetical protein [Ferruginibacter sp.]